MNILLCTAEGIVSMENSPDGAAAKMSRQPALNAFLIDFVDGEPVVNTKVKFALAKPITVATVAKVELLADGELVGSTQVKSVVE